MGVAAKVKVLCVATHPTAGYANFLLSLWNNGFDDVEVLEWQQPWKGWKESRMEPLRRALLTLDPNSLCFCIDTSDVICKANANIAAKKLLAALGTARVIAGAEIFCLKENGGRIETWWRSQNRRAPGIQFGQFALFGKPFVNAGLLGGYAGDLAQMYEWMLKRGHHDDQLGVADWANHHPTKFTLDCEEQIFINYSSLDPPAKTLSSDCLFVHFPGFVHQLLVRIEYNRLSHAVNGKRAVRLETFTPRSILAVTMTLFGCILVLCLFLFKCAKPISAREAKEMKTGQRTEANVL